VVVPYHYTYTFKEKVFSRDLWEALKKATVDCGATVYGHKDYEFNPDGYTATIILGESHSALHYFPEVPAVWVELATCTERTDIRKFFRVFEDYFGEKIIDKTFSDNLKEASIVTPSWTHDK
jgi:S-adenosylmethionine/arginine decarboxylase-like enzyme